MGDYIKCPRCELNYIHKDQVYCDVCKAELKMGPQLLFAIDDDDESEASDLCPICKQNYIKYDEDMCRSCREKLQFEKEDELDMDKDEEWRNFLDEEKDPILGDESEMLSLSQLEEEEGSTFFDDEEEEEERFDDDEPDDFEILPIDESDFEDREEEEDDEDEEM